MRRCVSVPLKQRAEKSWSLQTSRMPPFEERFAGVFGAAETESLKKLVPANVKDATIRGDSQVCLVPLKQRA